MLMRPAVYADLVPTSKVLARAFEDEPLFGEHMHPRRKQYPNDMYLHFLHKLRIAYVSGPGDVIWVAYKNNDQGREQQITGVAHWHRYGSSNLERLYSAAAVKGMASFNYLESLVYPNRAADPSRADVLARAGPYVAHHWTGTRSECWDLSLLGVDPTHERQGIGRGLVKWGFEKAALEGVGCSVISAEGKERFYQSCGFDQIVGKASDEGGDENPLKDIPGGTILFWDNERDTQGVKKYEGQGPT